MQILLYAATTIAYGVCAFFSSARVPATMAAGLSSPAGMVPGLTSPVGRVSELAPWARVLAFIGIVLHGLLLQKEVFHPDGMRFGFALALSATFWLGAVIFWLESLSVRMDSLRVVVYPAAALSALLPALFPGSPSSGLEMTPILRAHVLVAMLAYSTLTIAALHAIIMAFAERWLHTAPSGMNRPVGTLARLFDALPPLLAMERILFRLIGLGFILLTLTVLSGMVFSEALFGRPVNFDHKTVFTLVSWVMFGALVWGRHQYGWRGRRALRWTLGGFATLLLGYVGSRFVLEVILERVG